MWFRGYAPEDAAITFSLYTSIPRGDALRRLWRLHADTRERVRPPAPAAPCVTMTVSHRGKSPELNTDCAHSGRGSRRRKLCYPLSGLNVYDKQWSNFGKIKELDNLHKTAKNLASHATSALNPTGAPKHVRQNCENWWYYLNLYWTIILQYIIVDVFGIYLLTVLIEIIRDAK